MTHCKDSLKNVLNSNIYKNLVIVDHDDLVKVSAIKRHPEADKPFRFQEWYNYQYFRRMYREVNGIAYNRQ